MNTPPTGQSQKHGIWRLMPSQTLTEILAQAGLDFQILDCEHGTYDFGTLQSDVIACERWNCEPWIRVSGTDKIEVQRCLDLGARAIVFPQLNTVEDFARAAATMDYPPKGARGFNPCVRALEYGLPQPVPVNSSERPWFVPIIETLVAVDQIERILELDRIDLVYIGAFDLSAQCGSPGEIEAPQVVSAMERILVACRERNLKTGLIARHRTSFLQQAHCLVHGVDTLCIKSALQGLFRPSLK